MAKATQPFECSAHYKVVSEEYVSQINDSAEGLRISELFCINGKLCIRDFDKRNDKDVETWLESVPGYGIEKLAPQIEEPVFYVKYRQQPDKSKLPNEVISGTCINDSESCTFGSSIEDFISGAVRRVEKTSEYMRRER